MTVPPGVGPPLTPVTVAVSLIVDPTAALAGGAGVCAVTTWAAATPTSTGSVSQTESADP